MSYRVIQSFADAQDKYYVYQAGEKFPRAGKLVDEKRIAELLTGDNALNTPLIEEELDERKPKKAKAKKKE